MAMSRSLAATLLTTRSPMRIWPSVIDSSPASMRSAVDLPQPDGPTRTMNSLSATSTLKSFTTVTSAVYRFTTWSYVTDAISCLPLYRSCKNAANEIALEAEEHDERHDHREERRRGEQLVALAERVGQAGEVHRQGRHLRGAADVDQRHQELVPHPQELEDHQGCERGHRQRKDDPEEYGQSSRAIDLSRLEEVAWQRTEEVGEEVCGERQTVAGVREPEADPRRQVQRRQVFNRDPVFDVELQNRDEGELKGYGEQADEGQEDPVSRWELHPRECVGGEGGNRDGDDRRWDRHHEAVEDRGPQVALHEQLVVVVEREGVRR